MMVELAIVTHLPVAYWGVCDDETLVTALDVLDRANHGR